MAIAGGGIVGGRVVGETSPTPKDNPNDHANNLKDPRPIEDLHATIFQAFGIESGRELMTPVGRPMKLCDGTPIRELLDV